MPAAAGSSRPALSRRGMFTYKSIKLPDLKRKDYWRVCLSKAVNEKSDTKTNAYGWCQIRGSLMQNYTDVETSIVVSKNEIRTSLREIDDAST
ncbi:hypothetical protein EVAR_74608_1 [Eumeta japonica]|uniref:Uncharacterized protein n=1 Tax=Eumeta variegata TaxID=151549 RepID=A0A4C1WAM5_EUMVA|nr:hypothetical protein EVAR_74608_1 [Eumeta japonica]